MITIKCSKILPILFLTAVVASRCINFNKVTKTEMECFYNANEKKILDLINFLDSISPNGIELEVQFQNKNEIAVLNIKSLEEYETFWELKINSTQLNDILQKYGLYEEHFKIIYDALQDIGCISVGNIVSYTVGYRTHLLNQFSFVLIKMKLNNVVPNDEFYEDNCFMVHFRDSIFFQYDSGAVGSLCFPDTFFD